MPRRGGSEGRGGRGGQRAGDFAVRISRGDDTTTQAFTVHNRAPATSALGQNPGEQVLDGEEDEDEREGSGDEK